LPETKSADEPSGECSITKKHTAPCRPAWNTLLMFWCSSGLEMLASRRKSARAVGPRSAMLSGSTLRATVRSSTVSKASYTAPLVPRPSTRTMRNWPIIAPGTRSLAATTLRRGAAGLPPPAAGLAGPIVTLRATEADLAASGCRVTPTERGADEALPDAAFPDAAFPDAAGLRSTIVGWVTS
jgi:hypothetical protein